MKTTPMMKQYEEAKAACGDAILLFRMGDFYELFNDDAEKAAPILGLALTSRDKSENPIPMAGFPQQQLDTYISRLIKSGFRVAVCDQVESAQAAKGLVRREVTRVVTPGTAIEDDIIDPREPNYLAAIKRISKGERKKWDVVGVAWVDLSTGLFYASTAPMDRVFDQIARISPKEILLSENEAGEFGDFPQGVMVTRRPHWSFTAATAKQVLLDHFEVATLSGFGFEDHDILPVQAAGATMAYLKETQKYSLDHIDKLSPYQAGNRLEIDIATRRSLELVRTLRSGERKGSLLSVMDHCVSGMGSRVLMEWLSSPLTDCGMINQRLDAVEVLSQNAPVLKDIGTQLSSIYDLERIVSKVVAGRATPRDLCHVGNTLARLPALKEKLEGHSVALLDQLHNNIELFDELQTKLQDALEDDCPITFKDGGFIKTGYNEQLDELRSLAAGGKDWIASYQAKIIEETGIPTLKVGFNRVFGYYLEVTNTNKDKAPDYFIRKQTLKNAERYITPELKEYEEKILSADQQAHELEANLFEQLRTWVAEQGRQLRSTARTVAMVDAIRSLAVLASKHGYCRPVVSEEKELTIFEGRHPVLDAQSTGAAFVPNDTTLTEESGYIGLITGPNMAGKSTYIRQNALITLMAQMGSFVPAKQATISVADRIFARVGASDELSRGQSTFMVEMTETANILNTATEKSLVILDEIGRGTSTYDGVSLAWAIVEFLHNKIGCRTLFATHYHELTDLANSLDKVKNLTVLVREWEEKIVFLHKITDGATDKSYGIHVARLAGVPTEVNARAKEVLASLESEYLTEENRSKLATTKKDTQRPLQLTLFGAEPHPLLETIKNLKVNDLTPIESLTMIHQWQQKLQEEGVESP